MKKNKVFVVMLCLSFAIGFSQKKDKKLKKANAKYEEFSFVAARKKYMQLVEKGNDQAEVYARLGDTYFFNADYKNALIWYTKLMEKETETPPEYKMRYSVCLRADEQYNESETVLGDYFAEMGKENEAKKWDLDEFVDHSERYSGVTLAGLDPGVSGFGAMLVPNEEVYKRNLELKKQEKAARLKSLQASGDMRRKADGNLVPTDKFPKKIKKNNYGAEESADSNKQDNLPNYKEIMYAASRRSWGGKNKWHNKSFSRLYSAEIAEDGTLRNEKEVKGLLNSKYSESTPAITKDGQTMYFTRLVPYFDESKDTDKERVGKKEAGKKSIAEKKNEVSQLRLFQARKKNDKWVDVTQMPYPLNVAGSSSAHPALSPNDDYLYFVSNRNKKTNDTDIYVVKRKNRGGFEREAELLGEEINTLGRETFPSVDANGILYFSSDSHPGFGGLDVFAATKDPKGKYSVVNVGEPINSKSDDFAYVIDSDSKKGFFSSDRNNVGGEDNLYKFVETRPVVFPFKLDSEYSGTVKNSLAKEPIANAKITVYNQANEIVAVSTTDFSGRFQLDLPPLRDYSFEFFHDQYQIKKEFVPAVKNLENKEVSVELFNELTLVVDGEVINVIEGQNLAKILKIKALYFDYAGYNIRKSTKMELDKVIDFMRKRPSVSLEIRCHTDSRGRDDFNLNLSKNRAKTMIDYLIKVGEISSNRLIGNGYGETEILNKCTNGVRCTEAEHDENRRTDFIISIKK